MESVAAAAGSDVRDGALMDTTAIDRPPSSTERRYTLGADIGGTFTDLVLLRDDGHLFSRKVLSTPDDYSRAIGEGVEALLGLAGAAPDAVVEVAHGTTVATNAIIERKGVKVGLVTTQGFRDVLEIGRFRSPRLYDLRFRKPDPLVERRLRFGVRERMASDGSVLQPLDLDDLARIAHRLADERVDAVAVCFLNAYANPAHESAAVAFLGERLPGVPVTASTHFLPQINEYERTSTTVVNAYLRPVVEGYLSRLEKRLAALGLRTPLMIMQSSGGLLPASLAARNPVYIIESGPAAGVVGASRLSRQAGLDHMIVFDMGGTTAKACLVERGCFGLCPETEVGGSAALGHRLIQGAGYIVQAPTIDIAEVGAGGGSIAFVDDAGGMRVGPRSAGAVPGPACYARGGTLPTVTDANVILGYLNPTALCGGELPIDRQRAERAVGMVATRAGIEVVEAAHGIHQIANATMMRALHGVSTERGRDPAQYALLAIGGNGAVHACHLAEALRIRRIVVPPVAGLFSALGMLFADVEHHLAEAFYRRLADTSADEVNAASSPMLNRARDMLAAEGFPAERQRIVLQAEAKYVGQGGTLSVPLESTVVDARHLARLGSDFAEVHTATFGYRSDEPLQLVALKVVAQGLGLSSRIPRRLDRAAGSSTEAARQVYFGPAAGWLETPVLDRAALSREGRPGPLVVEEYDCTTVVAPGWQGSVDERNDIVLEQR